jgi:molecular chaperone DnaJ
MADHYETLGVDRRATAEELKKAYRRRARELHPDANPDDPEAEARFKEVARAYEVLSDPARRQRYDAFGDDGDRAGGMGGGPGAENLGDIFSMFFGGDPFGGGRGRGPSGPPRGVDLETRATITLAEAVAGTQSAVSVRTAVACEDCGATGAAPGAASSTCPDCGGSGQVQRVRQSILGQMVTAAPCQRCDTTGTVVDEPCPTCRGEGRQVLEKTYTVDIPAGIDDGQTLRLAGRGAAGPRGGAPGDLFVHVAVAAHDRFERRGDDLVHELHVAFTQAALGAELPLETFDGEEVLVVSPGTQSGSVQRLRGLGVPRLQGRGRGDLLVVVVVDVPTQLDDEEEALLRRLADLRDEPVAEPGSGLMDKIRSAFR